MQYALKLRLYRKKSLYQNIHTNILTKYVIRSMIMKSFVKKYHCAEKKVHSKSDMEA